MKLDQWEVEIVILEKVLELKWVELKLYSLNDPPRQIKLIVRIERQFKTKFAYHMTISRYINTIYIILSLATIRLDSDFVPRGLDWI